MIDNDRILELSSVGDTLQAVRLLASEDGTTAEGAFGLNRLLYGLSSETGDGALEAEQQRIQALLPSLDGDDQVTALYNLGCIALSQDDVVAGMDLFQEALNLKPDHIMARHNLAYSFELMAEYDKAIVMYEQVLAQNPEMALTRLNMALLQIMDGDLEGALEVLHDIHIANSDNPGITLYLCRALIARGHTQDLEEVLDLVEVQDEGVAYLDLNECRAMALFQLGDIDAADKVFNELLEENPENLFARMGKIKVLAENYDYPGLAEAVRALNERTPSEELEQLLADLDGLQN